MKTKKTKLTAALAALILLSLSLTVTACNKADAVETEPATEAQKLTEAEQTNGDSEAAEALKSTVEEQTNGDSEATEVLNGHWTSATYTKDTVIGEGNKEVRLDIEIDGKTVTLTLKTDKDKLGEAMFAEKLINDPSFFDTLNGMKVDWNTEKAYWGFYKGNAFQPVGVNQTDISGGEHYRFVYTK